MFTARGGVSHSLDIEHITFMGSFLSGNNSWSITSNCHSIAARPMPVTDNFDFKVCPCLSYFLPLVFKITF